MRPSEELFIGLMSGTSVDGIDAALVAFESSSSLRVVDTEFTPFPAALRAEINNAALNNAALFKNEDSPLHTKLADYYADASLSLIKKAGISKNKIRAIANHGQTVRHEPNAERPFSLQLGDGQRIANITDIQAITQFRQADIALGGQGAPLMPAFHNAVFGSSHDTFVLNLGGIANISQLSTEIIGFDTGPGNCLLDQWIEKHQGERFDKNGAWAKSGMVIDEVLSLLMQDSYLHQSHPKSTGTDHYNLDWLEATVTNLEQYSPSDIQATLLTFTVKTISHALQQLEAMSGRLFVCGGGAQNQALMSELKAILPDYSVAQTDDLGVPCDWVEAVGFAWLGYCFEHGIPSNLPSVTGASRKVVLGESFMPQ